jgi:hypothetical protein
MEKGCILAHNPWLTGFIVSGPCEIGIMVEGCSEADIYLMAASKQREGGFVLAGFLFPPFYSTGAPSLYNGAAHIQGSFSLT